MNQTAQKKVYKCYISDTNDEKYYWYFADKDAYPYGNENSLKIPVKDTSQLDRVANVNLYSITDTTMHVIFDHNIHIYGVRDTFFDIEEDTDAN